MENYSRITYLYRDAGNYKKTGKVYVKGRFTEDLKQRLKNTLSEGMYFIPEQIGLELPLFDDGFTEDDHCWCELDPEYDIEEVSEKPEVLYGTAESLVETFESAAKSGWNDVVWGVERYLFNFD